MFFSFPSPPQSKSTRNAVCYIFFSIRGRREEVTRVALRRDFSISYFRFVLFLAYFSVQEKEKGKTEITFFFGNVLEKFEKRGENGIEMCPIGLTSVNVIFSKLEVSSLFITRRDVLLNFWPRIYEVRNWEFRRSGRECVVKWCKAFRLFILDKLYNW